MEIGVRSPGMEENEVVEEERVLARATENTRGLIASRTLPDMRSVARREAQHPMCPFI
jgi:hypothetical protein